MKVKIGFVISSLSNGGAERVMAALCNYFSEKYEVVLITLVKKDFFHDIAPSIVTRSLNASRYSSNPVSALFSNYADIKKLRKIIDTDRIDILISFTTSANVIATLAAKKARIPCIISERNNAKYASTNSFWKFARKRFYKFANYLVVQTEGNKIFYSDIVPQSKIKIIQNPISKAISTTKLAQETKTNLSILTLGRLNKNKAVHIALKALSTLKDLNWNYTVVGDGPSRETLEVLTKELGIEERVNFTGAVKNVADYYQRTDIFVFTSRSEGLPNALMEAHYLGLPAVSTNCDFGPSDIINDGEDGFLVPVDDVQAMAEKLKLLILNESLRQQFSKNARNRASRFEMEKIGAKWENLIDSALEA